MYQELLNAYAEIVRNAPSAEVAAAHLASLLLDVSAISKVVAEAIDAARQRAAQ